MKNLSTATNNELEKMIEMAIGRAFRMASEGNEELSLKAKNEAVLISLEIKSRG